MRKNPARARSLASPSGKRLPASMRSRSARIRGRKARVASMALVAVLLVAIGPPALPHGRDRSVSHVGLGMAGLGGGIAAPYRRGRLARSISTHQIRRDASAALVQRLQKASDSRIELCRLFPMNEPARPWDRRSFVETLHSAQHLRLVGIGILVAADAEHGYIEFAEFRDKVRNGQPEFEHASPVFFERMACEHLDDVLPDRRVHWDHPIDRLTAVLAQERHQAVAAFAFEHSGGLRRISLPALKILQGIMHLAPSAQHESAHVSRIPDRIIGGNRGAEGERDDNWALDAEAFD